MVENFGSGKSYVPGELVTPAVSKDSVVQSVDVFPEETVQAQGVLDIFKLMDAELIDKVKALVTAVDPAKVKAVMDMIETDEEGWIKIKIDLRIKK